MIPFEQLVRSELARVTGLNVEGKQRIKIRCPFHNDSNPSLHVTIAGKFAGGYKCFACGATSKDEGMGWDALADRLGMQKKDPTGFTYVSDRRSTRLPAKKLFGATADAANKELVAQGIQEGLSIPQLMNSFQPRPVVKWRTARETDDWRGFNGHILRLLRAYRGEDNKGMPCTVLPVTINGDLVGGIKCKNVTDGPKDPFKYINSEGAWTRTIGLFGYDLSSRILDKSEKRDLFICEGQRSALALIRLGVPAVAILGVHNWSEEKAHLLLGLAPDRVFTAFDGDDAGRKANKYILPVFKGYAWRKRIDLPDKQDPFDMATKPEYDGFWEGFLDQYGVQRIDLTTMR